MKEITVILGGSGGLGREVAKHFPDASNWSPDTGFDIRNFSTVYEAVIRVEEAGCKVLRLINCAGVNLIAPLDDVGMQALELSMAVNAFGFFDVIRSLRLHKLLAPGFAACNVISNAAHMPMTHSIAYNASKAAQEMITRQMAREWKEYCIFGVNPNKLHGTPMSLAIEERVCELRGWTKEEAKKYQLAALPAGVETPPSALASFIAELMRDEHHPYITGCIFPYGGPQ